MESPRVVVVGAGVAGLSTALHLSAGGAAVTVLEAGEIAGGSSGLSVGIIESQYLEPLDIELRVRSLEFFAKLEREGLHIVRNGYLRLCRTPGQLAAAHRSVEIQKGFGVIEAAVLDAEQIGARIPDLALDGVIGGLFGATDGYIDGHDLCRALAEHARGNGVTIITGAPLEAAEFTPGGVTLRTPKETFSCDVVVNAAGAWGSRVGDILEAPIQISPQLHMAAFVQLAQPLPYLMPSVMDYTPHSGGYGLYFRDEGPGRLIAGLHTEEVVHEVADLDHVPRTADEGFLATVAEKLQERLPSLDDAALNGGWSGLYPVTADGYPLLGPHPTNDRVLLACGLGGFGIQVSPVVGQIVADWVLHGEPRSLPAAASLLADRFEGSEVHSEPSGV